MLTNQLGKTELLANLKVDLPAGIVVFLVSIPMSLGIALASGAPLFSGLITGIIGGLVVAPLSGSQLAISGTAAGLSVLVLAAINELSFNGFLLALVIAGLLQILLGLLKAGVIAHYFPSSVINGMLSGIGIILFLKQIPHALGYDSDYEGDFSFFQADHTSSFSELVNAVEFISPTAIVIALISLIPLILWEQLFIKSLRYSRVYQGILLAVLLGIFSNQYLVNFAPELALKDTHLVMIPVFNDFAGLLAQFHTPDFSLFDQPRVYLIAATLALVASLETLICVEAVDKLDPYRRVTSTNRELMTQGLANIGSGLIGGLPLTQVIVRSSINIQAGARSKTAAVIQGVLMLLAVKFIPEWLNEIPLATLASVLLVVSYKLINPALFKTMYQAGLYHFIPFCATIVGLVFTDLLVGILIGLSCALFAILLENYKSASYFREAVIGNKIIFRLSEHVSFLNKANIKRTLEHVPANSDVVIDATRSKYMDYDVYEVIEDFKNEAQFKNIKLTLENMRGFGILKPIEKASSHTYDSQQSLTPAQVLTILLYGNEHFINNLEANRNLLEQVNDTQQGQFPIAIILSCMDSRTSVELIFDLGLGDVFSARVAGNIVNDDMLGSMEYACKVAGSKLIVVLGHTHCGAIKGACAEVKLDHLTGLLAKIQPAITAVTAQGVSSTEERVQKVAEKNVLLTVEQIRLQSSVLETLIQSGEIGIIGGMYDVETGRVTFFDPSWLV
ncbi:MAG: carbonic anhydrase family protein [Methylococcales bacterium]|nr:carbonic anhydrase family protein [Methylococcales bacterium]